MYEHMMLVQKHITTSSSFKLLSVNIMSCMANDGTSNSAKFESRSWSGPVLVPVFVPVLVPGPVPVPVLVPVLPCPSPGSGPGFRSLSWSWAGPCPGHGPVLPVPLSLSWSPSLSWVRPQSLPGSTMNLRKMIQHLLAVVHEMMKLGTSLT
jgi:hypothetical protein